VGSLIAARRRSRRLAWGICLLVGLGLGGAARAEESPLIEHVDQMMIDIGSQLTNARKRLTMSSGVVEQNPDGPSGMGLTCCTDNLRTIAEKLQIIRASMDRMADYYLAQENGEAIGILGGLDGQLRSIDTGAAIFARAPDEGNAAGALSGFVRPWNAFRNGLQSLRMCCPIPLPVDPESADQGDPDEGESSKKSKKKGKKKKPKKETAGGDDPAA